jgi:regulator of replication initiation timing
MGDLGWEMKLTTDGKELVKRLYPEGFWACGDQFSLLEALGEM